MGNRRSNIVYTPMRAPKNQPRGPIRTNYDVLARFTPFGDILRHFGKNHFSDFGRPRSLPWLVGQTATGWRKRLRKPTGASKNHPERPIRMNYDVLTHFTPFGDILRHFRKIEIFRILAAQRPRSLCLGPGLAGWSNGHGVAEDAREAHWSTEEPTGAPNSREL